MTQLSNSVIIQQILKIQMTVPPFLFVVVVRIVVDGNVVEIAIDGDFAEGVVGRVSDDGLSVAKYNTKKLTHLFTNHFILLTYKI